MADARSLLRQQRAARRIDHPYAAYSDSGKLTCTVCHEPIKSEAQWEGHTRGVGHRQKLLAFQKSRQPQQQKQAQPTNHTSTNNGSAAASKSTSKETMSDEALLAQIIGGGASAGQKRKHDDAGSDVEMDDIEAEEDEEEAMRKKRSKTTDRRSPTAATTVATATNNGKNDSATDKDAGIANSTTTPPSLVRRISGTPLHGVELQIPSRPATPSASGTSAGSTPRATSIGRSPLIPQEVQGGGFPTKQTHKAAFATTTAAASTKPMTGDTKPTNAASATADDEDDDWAAFEAEVVNTTTTTADPQNSKGTNSANAYAPDAVISAAPLTADQIAAKTAEEEHERRRAVADIELEDEKEEATRALETEFEDMEELEARVRRLKEKREALRKGNTPAAANTVAAAGVTPVDNGEGGRGKEEVAKEDEDEDEDDSDEDDDDWAGFRFRG
ncbi:hypothetical protein VMCG_07963 [Cytospora schulzeri]|uniref:Coiled-coil domain-containing protein 16 n=1 Tax=Cytospora schulzeri TaxID=448051 RepID=A0A423VY01_9PEZI|nr:hypothetical protein VMCG_07963 [Valsa malicola]